jgi:ankyrin repeat protein
VWLSVAEAELEGAHEISYGKLIYSINGPLHQRPTTSTAHSISHLHLNSVTMPPPQLPLEILIMIAHLLTDDKGELCFADFNSFLKVNRALYACLNRTLWQEAVGFKSTTRRVFTHLIHTNDLARLKFFLELGGCIDIHLWDFVDDDSDGRESERTPLRIAVGLDNVPMARLLLEYDADVVQYDEDDRPGYSAIHAARSAEMVQLLLDHHADPEQKDAHKFRPLHFYAKRGNIEAMRAILRKGAKVDPTSSWQESSLTPLHYAAQCDIDAVKLLLEHGANLKKKSYERETPGHLAAQAGKTDVVRLLLERWPEGIRDKASGLRTPLHCAAEEGKTDTVRLLLESWPAGMREKNDLGFTPLHSAAFHGNTDSVRLLAESWPEGMRERDDEWGGTPLHLAAEQGMTDAVRLLVELWPEGPREKGVLGDTPLHFAADMGHIDVIRLLMESWPEGKEAVNDDERTPLEQFESYTSHQGLEKRWDIIALLGGMYSP